MKNTDEMLNSLFKRREKYILEQNNKRQKTMKIGASVLSVCIVVMMGFGVWKSGILKFAPETSNSSETASEVDKYKPLPEDSKIIWADGNITDSDEGFTVWNSKNVTYRLFDALKSNEEKNCLYAILVIPPVDENFEFQGKTIAEYYTAMSQERNYPEKLLQLLKEGDSLKYGEALYKTGAPNGEKWAKELYEERTKFYGKEILDKYIVDGEFLRNELEQDIAAARNKKEASEAYDKAVKAYLTELAKSLPSSLTPDVVPERNCIIMYLTKDEFESFTVDNIDEWIFNLAIKDGDDAEYWMDFGVDE